MNLNYNSITAKIYRWFYAEYNMPKNLCPYFWKLVIMWIFIIPYAILSLPYIILYKDHKGDNVAQKPIFGFFLYFSLYLALSMLFSLSIFWIRYNDGFLFATQFSGLLLWLIGIILSMMMMIDYSIKTYSEWIRKRDYDRIFNEEDFGKERESSVIIMWIKSIYNKSCPKIDWTENDK